MDLKKRFYLERTLATQEQDGGGDGRGTSRLKQTLRCMTPSGNQEPNQPSHLGAPFMDF